MRLKRGWRGEQKTGWMYEIKKRLEGRYHKTNKGGKMTTKKSRARTRAKLELLWRDGRRCAICGKKIKDLDDLTIDHIVPLAKGGKNVLENYQLAHKACNEAKGSMLPKEHEKILKYNRRRIILMRIRKAIVVW